MSATAARPMRFTVLERRHIRDRRGVADSLNRLFGKVRKDRTWKEDIDGFYALNRRDQDRRKR